MSKNSDMESEVVERSIRWERLLPRGDIDSDIVHCFLLQIEEYKLRGWDSP